MKENLKIIKKGNKEIELIITNKEFDAKLESFINWIDTKMKIQIGLLKMNRDSLIREFEIYQMQKIKDMINILVDEVKNLGHNTGVIGIEKFIELYGESYNLTMFFKEHEIIDKWEIRVNE